LRNSIISSSAQCPRPVLISPRRLDAFHPSSNAPAAGLAGPLFDGGTLRAERRASIDALQADAARYQVTVPQAFGQVADQLEALDHDAEQLEAQQHAVEAAQNNVRLSQLSYHEGNVGVLQVLDAQRQFQQAKLGLVRAQAQRYIDTALLFLALGGSPLPSDSARPKSGSIDQHQSSPS
jgi:outer membrane protein TolC